MNTTALDHAALKTDSECSFTARKLRFFAGFRLACSSLATRSWRLSKRLIAAALLGLALVGVARAAIDTYEFKDEAERERFRTLTEELRCPKCQNQNIADSNAPIATDLRREIHRMLEEGKSNQEIVDFLVARYGDFVRYKPPVNARTVLLWYGPAGLLVGGLVVLGIIVVRRRRVENSPGKVMLSADEQARLDALLNSENQDKKDS
jgi:cytochrome c-type biogenesis protein CcmH